ncbi:MAG: cytoskeleton protein RodZ [Aeromonas sp.]
MTTEQPHDFQNDAQPVGPGQLLRNAREQLGWTREQVGARIHLRPTLIEAMESDTYDKHIAHTFIRGYLRTYAKLVGIPDQTILAAYDKLGLTPPDNIDMQSFSRHTRRQANDSRLKGVTWLVILMLIGLSVAWWWQSSSRRSAGDDALAASEMSSSGSIPATGTMTQSIAVNSAAPEPSSAEQAAPVQAAMAQPDTQANAPVAVTGSLPVPSVPASQAAVSGSVSTAMTAPVSGAAPSQASDATSAPQLKLSFTGNCWLSVKDATGKTLFSGMKKANDELILEGAEPLKFTIGAPSVVKLEYKGNAFDMSRYNGGRIARFKLPQE